ncbi:MAG TPA: polysaccharide deacetylase family protein [Thermoanaerobaculia bacterium]|nr:polysaccharide deacetylase family protein [Thermoanaerobaculia bacterium]
MATWRPPALVVASLALHGAAAVALAAAPHQWRWLLGAALADHVAVAQACLRPRSRLLGPNLTRLPEAAARRGEVALTFDDGPDPEVTPRVLARLAERGALASFFCVGRRVAAHPEIAAAAAAAGHRIENHTLTHPADFAFHGPRAMAAELAGAQDAIAGACGRAPRLFRPPAGFRAPWTDLALHRAGLALATWTRRGFDAVSRDPRRVAARLLRGLAAGDVLLLHDGGPRRTVLEVLPRLLDALAARGLRAVPLPDPAPRAE